MEKKCKECERRENIGAWSCSFGEFQVCSCGVPVLTGKEKLSTTSHSLKGVEGKGITDKISEKNMIKGG